MPPLAFDGLVNISVAVVSSDLAYWIMNTKCLTSDIQYGYND